MKIRISKLEIRSVLVALVFVGAASPPRPAVAQTNLALSGSTRSNAVAAVKLPAVTDFQRLQYYYAAHPSSPPPGTERAVFTLTPERAWAGDWNSTRVPKPTRSQLSAITPAQVDLFKRAGNYVGGRWQITTSRTNIPLSQLTLTGAAYERLSLIIERDQALRRYQKLEQKVQALPAQ